MIFEGMCCYLQGNMAATADVVAELQAHQAPTSAAAEAAPDAANADRNAAETSQRLWTTLLTLLATIHGLDIAVAVPILEEARSLARQTTNDETHWSELVHLQQMLLRALSAYVLHRQGHVDAAVTEAKEALQCLSFLAGNPLFAVSYITFSLCSDVLLRAVTKLPAGPTVTPAGGSRDDDARLLGLVVQSLSERFDRFARYPFALAPRPVALGPVRGGHVAERACSG